MLNSSEPLLVLEPAETFPVIFLNSLLNSAGFFSFFFFFSISIFNYSSYNTEGACGCESTSSGSSTCLGKQVLLLVGRCNLSQ